MSTDHINKETLNKEAFNKKPLNKKTVFLFVQYEKTIFHHIISAVQPCDFLTAKPRHSRCRANQSLSPHSEKQTGGSFLEPYRHGGQ